MVQNMTMSTTDENSPESERMLPPDKEDMDAEIDELHKNMPLTEDTTCGFWIFKGPKLQMLANKKVLVFLFCLCGTCYASTFSYFNGTITTIEKRFKIPSKITGFISTGNDISQLLTSIILNYYASKGHRPRWIAMSLFCVTIYCFLSVLPHAIYGPGPDAIQLTLETTKNNTGNATNVDNYLCMEKDDGICVLEDANMVAVAIWFIAQLIAGVGRTLFHSVGYSYLDDNIKKSKSPSVIGFTYFMRMLGPGLGFAIASLCLQWYIVPQLTPVVDPRDPRWLGAWWIGWIFIGLVLLVLTISMAMLPKTLPRAAARKQIIQKYVKNVVVVEEVKPSVRDMIITVKRLLTNPIFNLNTLASLFYIFGYTPFWIFLPKYIETQFNKSAVFASMVTGSVGLAFSAIGVLVAGYIVQRFQPKAKYMSFWNMVTDFIGVLGILSYTFLGCPDVDERFPNFSELNTNRECNADCECDFVNFSPVCSVDQTQMFISPCHAGCTLETILENGETLYKNCSCIALAFFEKAKNVSKDLSTYEHGGYATSGLCPVSCDEQFYIFLVIICVCKFIGSLNRVSNYLIIIRCVDSKDMCVSLGLALTVGSIFAMIPAPIFFGYIIDSTCTVWGKTCDGTGNCWLYDPVLFRERLVYISTCILMIGVFLDVVIWWKIKDINMYDEVQKNDYITPMEMQRNNESINETRI